MKRILYITYDWWFDTDVDVIKDLSKEFLIDVYVISLRKNNLNKYPNKKLFSQNVNIHDYRFWDKSSKFYLSWCSFIYALRLIWISRHYDLIFYIDDSNPVTAPLLSVFMPKDKVVVTFHDYHMHVDEPGFKNKIHNLIINRFRYFHFFSRSQYEYFIKEHPSKKAFYSLMPLKDFGEKRAKHNNGKKTFLFFGYIRPYKRLDLFIQAAKELSENSNFIIAGYCKDWEIYERKIGADKRFISEIKFVPNDEIPDYFSKADYLVLPYNDSTQSGPLLIAVNYGVPVIASNHKIFQDFITDGVNGFLFKDGDVDDLKRAMLKAESLTDGEWEKMQQNMLLKKDEYSEASDFIRSVKTFWKSIK